MKKLTAFLLAFCFLSNSVLPQSIFVGGQCMSGTIELLPGAEIDGKPSFEGTGDVLGLDDVPVAIFWMPAPDNVWVVAFDGQPFFQNACGTDLPPGSQNTLCPWAPVDGNACTGVTPLFVTGNVALPILLIEFTANIIDQRVTLKWKTSSEINNKGFEIQKSRDGVNWKNIGFVNGHYLSTVQLSYQFTDPVPYKGRNAYRLRQVDLDGRNTYSPVAFIDFADKGSIIVSNNPGKGIYKISMPARAEKLELHVIDAVGKMIYSKTTAPGNLTLDITGFPAGTYLLRLKIGNRLYTERLVKL